MKLIQSAVSAAIAMTMAGATAGCSGSEIQAKRSFGLIHQENGELEGTSTVPTPQDKPPTSPGTGDKSPGIELLRGTLDPGCMNNPSYSACLVLKSPVAHSGRSILPEITYRTDLTGIQTYGVSISDLDISSHRFQFFEA